MSSRRDFRPDSRHWRLLCGPLSLAVRSVCPEVTRPLVSIAICAGPVPLKGRTTSRGTDVERRACTRGSGSVRAGDPTAGVSDGVFAARHVTAPGGYEPADAGRRAAG